MAYNIEWFFAWVDAPSTESGGEFDPVAHAVQDLEILGFTFEQIEGDFATLQITTRNPLGEGGYALGLLGPGRKRWAWFSWDKGDGVEPLFFGRLVGIPTDVFGAKTVLDFQARPVDYIDQKEALAEALRVMPWYDETFYDEERRSDPEIVLEARSAVWHVDPVTHELSISDILLGEEDTLIFTAAQHLFTGMEMQLGTPPLTSVEVDAEFVWTQRALGNASMTITSSSYTLAADAYPKVGAAFGDGWVVQSSTVSEPYTFAVQTRADAGGFTIKWWDGNVTSLNWNESIQSVIGPGIALDKIVTDFHHDVTYDDDGNVTSDHTDMAWSTGLVPLHEANGLYVLQYDAERPMTEHVTFTLSADVQQTVTLPGEDETMRLEKLRTVDLSGGEDVVPIGDPRRRSYVATDRGRQSILHLILRARSHLRLRARCANITFAPFIDRLAELKLNKSATVTDWRLPGGQATGKIIGYTCSLTPPSDGSGGSVTLNVTIGCSVGNGGVIADAAGTADYVEDDYILQDEDWQEYEGRVLTFNDDVGFTLPLFDPDDDGIDFMNGGLNEDNMFEVPITITQESGAQEPPGIDAALVWKNATTTVPGHYDVIRYPTWQASREAAVAARAEMMAEVMSRTPTQISFKLKNMKQEFKTEIPITVEQLKIPKTLDLSAV